jgi:hypothetical protein
MSETTNSPLPVKRVNLRTPDVMAAVQAQVETHYRSEVVERVRANGGILAVGGVTVKLAKQFGFCYGVERAIDLAYAARKVFAEKRVFILGEIIHNPEVNRQIADMGIVNIVGPGSDRARRRTHARRCRHRAGIWHGCGHPREAQAVRGSNRRYHLRRRDERVETREAKCQRGHDQHHPRQGFA